MTRDFKYYWGIIVLGEIFFLVFLTSFFPDAWLMVINPILISVLYLTTTIGVERHRKQMIWIAACLLVAQAIFKGFNFPIIEAISKVLNIAYFSIIVVVLITQISSAREVDQRVILQAINGYLLLGLVYSFMVGLMLQVDPQSFNFSDTHPSDLREPIYFGFVTFATLGYGDLLPLKPYAKSLSILIAVSGQLYIAVIIALLVGKFASRR